MPLLIRVLALNDRAPDTPISGLFNESGGSLGRAHTSTVALPDPQRVISRLQAQVTFDEGRYWIHDVGTGVVTHVNGVPVPPGQRMPLKAGDAVQIGDYRLSVEDFDDDRTQPVPAPRAASAAAPASGPPARAADPFGDLLAQSPAAGRSARDPFADLFVPSGAASANAPVTPRPASAKRPASQEDPFAGLDMPGAARPEAAPSRLPDDFDPFAEVAPSPVPAPAPAAPASPFDLVGDPSNRPGSLDAAFRLASTPGRDPLDEFLSPPAPSEREKARDPLELINPPAAAPIPPGRGSIADHTPDLQAAYQPPKPVEPAPRRTPKTAPVAEKPGPAPAPAPAAPAAPRPSRSAAVDELWRAFLEGAGLPPSFPQPPTPHVMRTIGMMLRYQIDGTLRLIAARAAAKNALRAGMTLVQARGNNPLKFSPNAQAALTQLLQPPAQGFLAPLEAVRDAMNDIESHQIGTMAGMRAALEDVLKRFEPGRLEGRLTTRTALEALVPAARKARLWDMYLQHFDSIREDAKEGFHEVFGKAFIEAYEEQVERLRAVQGEDPI